MSPGSDVIDPSPARDCSTLSGLFRGVQSRLLLRPCHAAVTIDLAGLPIRLEFESAMLSNKLAPAFGHLEIAAAEPELTILVREDPSLFESVFPVSGFTASENEIWVEEGEDLTVILQRQGNFVAALEWPQRKAYWLVPDAASIPYILRAQSLQPLLARWLVKQQRYFVHGAAVGHDGNGVLILGHGGAGKSTTALLCLEAGMQYLADDHCLVSSVERPLVHSIYGTGKIAFEEMSRFPTLAPAADTRNRPFGEKALFFLAHLPAAHLAPTLRLRSVLLARITEAPLTRLRAAAPAEAFKALVESCSLHSAAARVHALRCFNRLARELPAHVLELGADLRSTPDAIRDLLARLPD